MRQGGTARHTAGPAARQRQALEDAARVLASPALSGQAKRDAVGLLIEKVIPNRRQKGTETKEMETAVCFLPGLLGGGGPDSRGEETLQSTQRVRHGTLTPRAATQSLYQSVRESVIAAAPAASRMWAGSLEPTRGMTFDGWASSQARASWPGVAPP